MHTILAVSLIIVFGAIGIAKCRTKYYEHKLNELQNSIN